MNTLLIYMIKAAFYLAAFYMVYTLLLSRDTLYRRNRAYILFSVTAAFILPLITIRTNTPVNLFFGKTLNEVLITGANDGTVSMIPGSENPGLQELLLIIYLSGLVLFSGKLILDMMELVILVIRNRNQASPVIRFSGMGTSGFSALGFVFINSALSEEDEQEILKHEQNHLDHHHFIDIIFIELLKVFHWFNPFIHLFDRSLRAVHEFQADEECLKTGVPMIIYQRLIMNQVFRSRTFTMTDSFSNTTLLKKRMIMMTKERSRMPANLKLLMVLPVIAVVMIAFSTCKGKTNGTEAKTEEIAPQPPPPPPPADTDKKVVAGEPVPADAPPPPPPPPPPFTVKDGDTTWIVVDKMPVFKGGESALLTFIAENTTYPESAKEAGIQGKVIVGFVVGEDGKVSNVKITKGIDPAIDAEAVRVVKMLPPFERPGVNKGKPVQVFYWLPIVFNLD